MEGQKWKWNWGCTKEVEWIRAPRQRENLHHSSTESSFYFPRQLSTSIRTYSCTRELTFERITVIQDTSYRQCQKTQHRPFSHIFSITLRSRISPCSSSGTNPLFLPHRYSTISLQPLFLGMSKSPNAKKSKPYGSALAHQVVQFKTGFGEREND